MFTMLRNSTKRMSRKNKVRIACALAVVLLLCGYLFVGIPMPARYIEKDGYKISVRTRQSPLVQHTAIKQGAGGNTVELKIMSTPYYVTAQTREPESLTVSKWYAGRTYVTLETYALGEYGYKRLRHTQQILLEKASEKYISSIDWYMFE